MIASVYKSLVVTAMQLALVCLLFLAEISDAQAGITINGVGDKVRDNILAYMQLDDEACDAPGWRVRRLFKEAENEISEALEVVGYYHAKIEKKLELGEACWKADFNIATGGPVLLRSVSIEVDSGGEQDKKLADVVQKCALRSGDILQHANYDLCRRNINRTAKRLGYFDGKFIERRIDVYPAEYAADIALHFETGRRYVFGETTFEQTMLDPRLVERVVTASPGQPYDADITRRMQRDLIASAYFDQVELINQPRGEPYFDVPIHIRLTPGKKYQYSAGIGYATDVGPKLRFGVLNRRINKKGHQVEFEVNLSNVISDTGLTYRIPLNKPEDWFTIDTFYKVEDNDSFQSNLFSAGVQRIQKRENGWIRTLFLNLRLEDYEAGTFDDGRSKLLTPGISYSFVTEEYPPRPLEGHRSNVQMRGAVEGIVTDTSFLQLYGNTKWVFGLWSSGRLLTRAEAGATLIDHLDSLPASVRYFAGGDTSVRGYAYNSLGPTDPLGGVVGGENLLVGSIELDQKIAADWSLAAFVDSGNAFDAIADFEPATGVGIGVRWFSPLGPIRFDVAVPLESDAPDAYRIHITLGPDL
ncbi:MAG: autotransporter assembly complex protein TamA [Gammaproteobacteria bacterium]|jgi:translocation and assembly module TamA|nr:autotransporter assembly complex protein TamA [Gammaproteobacteria bacterium]